MSSAERGMPAQLTQMNFIMYFIMYNYFVISLKIMDHKQKTIVVNRKAVWSDYKIIALCFFQSKDR